MDNTPLLSLPLLADKQDLQTTFHDEALKALDALVMLSAIDRDLSSPPASPAEGDRYIVKAPGSGDDAWQDDNVVVFADGHWVAHPPQPGWTCYLQDEAALIAWDGSAWQPALDVLGGGAANNLALLGVGTTADAVNPFSARLNNALWVAKTVAEGGDGDLRYKLSKEDAANTLSLLFQDNFSGRAEIGLAGDDDFHFKVSPDGSAWIEALTIDRATGGARLRAHETAVASAATCDIGAAASLKVDITGTTTIVSLGSEPHRLVLARFSGALTLTHDGTSLILPGAADIVTAAGDTAIFVSDASGDWRCLHYQRAASAPLRYADPAALTAQSAGHALTAASGVPRLLASGTLSGAASLDIDLTGYTAYRGLVIYLGGVVPATDAAQLEALFSTDGGASFDASGYNYTYANIVDSSATVAANVSGSAPSIQMTPGLGNLSTEGFSGEVKLLKQSSTALWSRIFHQGYMVDDSARGRWVSGGGSREAAQDTDAIRIRFSSGNIATGDWAVYGLP